MRYLDTFSGIGGFAIPRSELGHECIGFSEIDRYATQIYRAHFPSHIPYGDVTRIAAESLPDFDLLLIGGFPCQAFSIAGKRRGFADTRGTLFFDLARILQAKRPRLFLFENVKGLLSHDGGRTFRTIIAALDELGYDLQWQALNSRHFGVPQNRERVFIVGHSRGTTRPEVFPFADLHCVPEPQSRADEGRAQAQVSHTLKDSNVKADSVFIRSGPAIRRSTPTECERLQGFPDGWTAGVSDTQRFKTLGNAVTVNVVREIERRLS